MHTQSSPAPCPLCGSSSVPYLEKFSLTMSRCRFCGAVFTDPLPAREVVAARYCQAWFDNEYLPSYGIDPSKPSLDHLAARYAVELDPLERFRTHGRILDVGAGAGLFLYQARARGWLPFGVELSSYGPTFAKQHFGIEIRQGTLESVKFESGYFDAVVFQDTIEHVDNPSRVVQEMCRIVRPGGAVVISTPNFNSLGRRFMGEAWALISPAEHLVLFTPDALKRFLLRTGFSTVDLSTTDLVSSALIHQGYDREERRKKLVRLLQWTPSGLKARLRLGDEIHAIAIR